MATNLYKTADLGGVVIVNNTALFNGILEWESDYGPLPVLWTPDGGDLEVTDSGAMLISMLAGYPIQATLLIPDDATISDAAVADLSRLVNVNLVRHDMPGTSQTVDVPLVGTEDAYMSVTWQHVQGSNAYSCAATIKQGGTSWTSPTAMLGTAVQTTGSTDLDDLFVVFVLTTDNLGIAVTVTLECGPANISGVTGRRVRLSLGSAGPLSSIKALFQEAQPYETDPGSPYLGPGQGGTGGTATGESLTPASPGGSGSGGHSGTPGSDGKGGISQRAGGNGNRDQTTDHVPKPAAPATNIRNLGFTTTYALAYVRVQELAKCFWSTTMQDQLKENFTANPMDAVVDLMMLPVLVPRESTAVQVHFGPYAAKDDQGSPITGQLPSADYVDVVCGSIRCDEYYGSCHDYAPYTAVKAFLPYIGFVDLDPNDIMAAASDPDSTALLTLTYRISVLTGDCVAYIERAGTVLYTFDGSMATHIGMTGITRNMSKTGLLRAFLEWDHPGMQLNTDWVG